MTSEERLKAYKECKERGKHIPSTYHGVEKFGNIWQQCGECETLYRFVTNTVEIDVPHNPYANWGKMHMDCRPVENGCWAPNDTRGCPVQGAKEPE